MSKYYCILKSGTDYPDWEYEVEAKSKKEAATEILKILHWDNNMREHIERSLIRES